MVSLVNAYERNFLAVQNDSEQSIDVEISAASLLDIERRRFSPQPSVGLNDHGEIVVIDQTPYSCSLSIHPAKISLAPKQKTKVALKLETDAAGGVHSFRVFVNSSAGSPQSVDVDIPVIPDYLTPVDRNHLKFKFHATDASKPKRDGLISPRGLLGEDVLTKSITLQNKSAETIDFQLTTDNPCFTLFATKSSLLPGEVTRIKVQFKPNKKALAQEKHDDPLLAGYTRTITEVRARLLVEFGSGSKTQEIEMSAEIVRPDVRVIDLADKVDYGFTHVEYPLHKVFTLTNRTSATGAWKIEHIARENTGNASPGRTVGELETQKADDAGFEVFVFDRSSGEIRGPSRVDRIWPPPRLTPFVHHDSVDFEPEALRISFVPKKPGYVQSRFRLTCGDTRKEFVLCGCASTEEIDANRLVNGLLRSLA